MTLKSRIQKVESNLMKRENIKEADPHGKCTPFRKKAVELWYSGDLVSLKEHCKDEPEFYERLVSYTKVIEKVAAQYAENEVK